jgi:hypothetical protein
MISTPLGSSRVHADRAEEGDLAVKELLQQQVVSSLVGKLESAARSSLQRVPRDADLRFELLSGARLGAPPLWQRVGQRRRTRHHCQPALLLKVS